MTPPGAVAVSVSHHTVDYVPKAAEKYLEPVLAAAWAVAELGQATPVTLNVLHTALAAALPDWAGGDVLAARHHLAGLWYPIPPPAPYAHDTASKEG